MTSNVSSTGLEPTLEEAADVGAPQGRALDVEEVALVLGQPEARVDPALDHLVGAAERAGDLDRRPGAVVVRGLDEQERPRQPARRLEQQGAQPGRALPIHSGTREVDGAAE